MNTGNTLYLLSGRMRGGCGTEVAEDDTQVGGGEGPPLPKNI